ncbi:Cytochrome P450 monooxygenase [Psilocybe cubensis]|uniref:Cytochrome P450 monooxygenase n=1 Tax=Psilocybe cubensis TaxID=181762 RepID=A0ACB8H5K5_PSICU|nr:Cytochrome P450 monooxygenase [Psilocybe cubensis]KAH9483000.1 Cytochrome P450 monooxygenase [Psilocybe cubensis]
MSHFSFPPTAQSALPVAIALIPLYIVARIVYRLTWHPLAIIPGPKLAASTSLYRAYYDVVCDGEWSEHLHVLHERYGTVVRVGPNELHFSDPNAYADIYGTGSTFPKDEKMYRCFGSSKSVFGQTDFHQAQKHRAALGPLFSRRATLRLEQEIQKHVDHLISQLLTYQKASKAADLHLALRSVTLDVVTSYCFGSCFNALDYAGFAHPVAISMDATLHLCWLFKHIPILRTLTDNCPQWIGLALMPATKGYYDQANQLGAQIDEILENPQTLTNSEHETMYHYFIEHQGQKHGLPGVKREESQQMTTQEKAQLRLWLLHEGLNLRFAGSETVGNACTLASFYILKDQFVKKRLVDELVGAWPDVDEPMGYEELEKLPYLTAVIKEALRLSWGTVTPMPRVVGPAGGVVAGLSLPPGTTIAMGNTIMHRNPDIFPDPLQFIPERWLRPDSAATLDRYLVAFSKGPRACIGINLAWCELYLILGNMFRKLELTDDGHSSLKDLEFREYFIPLYRGHHLHAYVEKRDQ